MHPTQIPLNKKPNRCMRVSIQYDSKSDYTKYRLIHYLQVKDDACRNKP